jgi:hypothetical protein
MDRVFFDERFDSLASQLNKDVVNQITPLLVSSSPQNKVMRSYHPALIATVLEDISRNHRPETLLLCKKVLLVGIILNNWHNLHKLKIVGEYKSYFERIYQATEKNELLSLSATDIFWKELAIARLQFFPIKSCVVDFYSGFGFRQGLTWDIFQSFKFLSFILKYGRKPYYRTHLHTPLLAFFSENYWIKSYLQIAEVLAINKSIKGLVRTSWYFDPIIKRISPHLSYLQELPLKNGAHLFCVGPDESGCALHKSTSRLALYNEGEYKPTNYLLVWPREAIISWAEDHKMRG